jgi:hypothetical protein
LATTTSQDTARRLDLADKVFGKPVFIHDMAVDGMLHARVIRHPSATATIASIDEAVMRRRAPGPLDLVRHGNFLAVVARDETVVEAVTAAADTHTSSGMASSRSVRSRRTHGGCCNARHRSGHRRRTATLRTRHDDP